MSRRCVVVVVGSFAVAGALLLTTRGAAERAKHSIDSGVLRVESRGCSRTVLGSGFLGDRTHLVTAAHVVDGADSIVLRRDGRAVAHGTIFGTDPATDVALIRLDTPVAGYALTLSTRAPKQGDDVFAVGYPLGEPLTVAHGSARGAATTV